jgi:hypothetical protein
MAVTTEDRLAIYELIALHGHLMDAGEFDQLDELFADDFVYDLESWGTAGYSGRRRSSMRRRGWVMTTRSATMSQTVW